MKTALITGAGSGLGRGLSCVLASRGYAIVAADLNPETAAEAAELTAQDGGLCRAMTLDVTSEESVQAFLADLGETPIDLLVNNAGVQHVAPLEEFAQDKWDLVLDVILRGSCLVTRAILPRMRAAGFGRIVLIGSIHSLVASPFKTAYVAAKHGLLGFAKTVALETADVDVTINTICPSYIRTPLVEAQIRDQARTHGIPEDEVVSQIMLAPMPKGAFISIEEVAGAIEYLASAAARNVTAQAIAIDGGWTAR